MKLLSISLGFVLLSISSLAGTLERNNTIIGSDSTLQLGFTFYYNETQCSDRWPSNIYPTYHEKREALMDYLLANSVDIDSIEVSYVYGLLEDCAACVCLSGYRYYVMAPDYYSNILADLNFRLYENPSNNPDFFLLQYHESQCDDPWHGSNAKDSNHGSEARVYVLADYLQRHEIDFISLEIRPTENFNDNIAFCNACDCGTGYRFDIVVAKQYEDALKNAIYSNACNLNAGFSYIILESNPIQIELNSTASYAETIIWKGISTFSLSDTIIGTGGTIRITDPYKFVIESSDCMNPPCPSTIDIIQVVINSCRVDSITKAIPVEGYTSVNKRTNNHLEFYPNPSSGHFFLKGFDCMEGLNYIIYDLNGRKLLQGEINSELHLDLMDGIYLIIINMGEKVLKRDTILIINNL